LIPLDLTHQVLGDAEVLNLIRHGEQNHDQSSSNTVRELFYEIMTFFASTYDKQFGMSIGPPLHDPLAVAAVFTPELFDDLGGERFSVYVVREGDDSIEDHTRHRKNIGQCGRTIARLLKKGEEGVRIPRTLNVEAFWLLINNALQNASREQ
jgi:uridine nucleosidase